MARRYVEEEPLNSKTLESFKDGYNSYGQSKLLVKDTEFPQGASNVTVDENGAATKRFGKDNFGPELVSGHAPTGGGILKTSSLNDVIVACNTAWYNVDSSSKTALTGVTFTADLDTDFLMADGKLWGANGTDALAYTSNGTSITSIGSNGNVGRHPVFFNQRMYMTNTSNSDRIYYSNPVAITLSTNPPTYTGLDTSNMFNTDLTASPKKNAGYIILDPGAGVEITNLYLDNYSGTDYLFAETKKHGIWRVGTAANNSDGSLAHTVVQFIPAGGNVAPRSSIKANNDRYFFDGVNLSTLGDVANYTNPRVTAKSGRIKADLNGMAASGRDKVAAGFFDSNLYFSYQTGSYPDRVVKLDTILNAWSAPYTGWNVSQFLNYEEDDGTRRFLGLSSNSADSFVYELETGTSDNGTAISATFTTKATDCDKPGLIKRFAFIDVFYSTVFGALTYEVLVDETVAVTGELQLGNSASRTVGVGSMPVGTFPVGAEYDTATTFASLSQNDSFRIDCSYTEGKKVSVRFTNNNTGEQFKINGITIWYLPGSIFEE